jgi:Cupredoxin-like domain
VNQTDKMSRRKLLRIGVVSSTGAAALLGVLGSQIAFGQQAGGGQLPNAGAPITMYLMPGSLKGPDGQLHDAVIPSSLVFQAGVPTTINVVNFDDGSHTITSPELGLDLTIQPGGEAQPVTTTATLTFPQAGAYRWYCNLQCDGPSHFAMSESWAGPGQDGYMAGNILVV